MAPKRKLTSLNESGRGNRVQGIVLRALFENMPHDQLLRAIGRVPLRGGGIQVMHEALVSYRQFLRDRSMWNTREHREVNNRVGFVEGLARRRGIPLIPIQHMVNWRNHMIYFNHYKK